MQYINGGIRQDDGYTWVNYAYMIVDINGPQKPNRVGRDIFYFNVNVSVNGKQKAYKGPILSGYVLEIWPKDQRETLKQACGPKSSGWTSGSGFTALIIHDNWRILDDYPW